MLAVFKVLAAALLATALAQTEPETCGTEETALFVMHIFDVSRSHENDNDELIPWLTNFEAAIESRYGERVSAVASFSDKPQAPFGDPRGDYCYREDKAFSNASVMGTAAGLIIRSGGDWKESQLEAMQQGLESGSVGWEWGPNYGERPVQRVVIVKTDALPHEAGDFNGCTGSNCDDPCLQQDYPTFASAYPVGLNVDVIFVVTGDVYSAWRAHTDSFPRYHTVNKGSQQGLTNEIIEILCSSVPSEAPTEPPTSGPLVGCEQPVGGNFASGGGTDSDCNAICANSGFACDPVGTVGIQTDSDLCRRAVAAYRGVNPGDVPFGGVKNEEGLAVGCNVESVTDLHTAYIRDGAPGCSSATLTPVPSFRFLNVCCCSVPE